MEKVVKIKRCKYSPIVSELKKQTEIAKNQGLDKVYELNKEDDLRKLTNKAKKN